MKHLQSWLFVVLAVLLFTSCAPSVINESDAKLFAACAGQPRWIGAELYDYVFQVHREKADTIEDVVIKDGDDWWNLEVLKDKEDDFGDAITEMDLYGFIKDGEIPESNASDLSILQNSFIGALFGMSDLMHSKSRAFKTAHDVCQGNFEPLKQTICEQVTVYDYRKNKSASSKKVTVYDVVYKIKEQTYVWCVVHDLGNKTYEINFFKASEMYSNLGY